MTDTPLLIAGLGNPGAQYARNRHNAGFMAVDTIHESYAFGPWRAKFQGQICEGKLARRKTYLLKPMTYMNESGAVGRPGRAISSSCAPSAVVVIHDEIDLAAGKLKVKTGGGDAGHNGLRSITAALGPDYRRVRIGVGHPGEKRARARPCAGEFLQGRRGLVGAAVDRDRRSRAAAGRGRRCGIHEQGGAAASIRR